MFPEIFPRIRIRVSSVPVKPTARQRGYPLRGASFAASVGIHSVWIGLLVLFSVRATAPRRPVYEELIRPYEHKIIFYKVPQKTPEVAPVERVGHSLAARGAEVSPQTIVATSPKPVSQQQTIWLPAPKIEIQRDIQAPNLIAKLDVPPPPSEPTKEKPRAFVPPPPNIRQPRLAMPIPVLSASAPALSGTSDQTPGVETKTPALPAPTVAIGAASKGNASADIAIASLHPTETISTEIPDGARPGQFSKAPEKGETASGDTLPNATKVPNLAILSPRPKVDTAKETPVKTVIYAERLRNVPLTSFSVPLRPSSRAIPKAIDARFQGRNVYTMVIPIENLPAYGGDWIIWFAEQSSPVGAGTLLRAPVPFRKLEPIEPSISGGTSVVRVQIAAILGLSGKLSDMSVLGGASPALKQRAIQDAMEWEFKPASRDGAPVTVELVLEIPFNLQIAQSEVGGP